MILVAAPANDKGAPLLGYTAVTTKVPVKLLPEDGKKVSER